jgi:hypothetical protein
MAAIPVPDQKLSASLHTLVSAVSAVAAAQASQDEAVEAVLAHVRRLRNAVPSSFDPDFVTVVRHIYWQHLAVPSGELAKAAEFKSPNEMTAAIGTAPSGFNCDGCGGEMRRTSRSWKPRSWARGPQLCKRCDGQRMDEIRRKSTVESVRRHHVDHAPVVAARTDWMAAVTLVLAYPPIGVGWSQEDAERNGLWLGYEAAQKVDEHLARFARESAVPVASRDGLDLLRAADGVIGWNEGRSVELIEAVTDESPTVVLTRLRRAIDEVRRERHAEALVRFPDDYVPGTEEPRVARR